MTSRNSYMRNYYNTNLSYKEQCKLKSKERYLKLKEKGIKQQLTEAQKEVKRLRDAEYKQKHKEQLKEKKINLDLGSDNRISWDMIDRLKNKINRPQIISIVFVIRRIMVRCYKYYRYVLGFFHPTHKGCQLKSIHFWHLHINQR